MGEMADAELEDVFDDEEDRLEYQCGNMQDDEAYDRGIIDELGCEIMSKDKVEKEDVRIEQRIVVKHKWPVEDFRLVTEEDRYDEDDFLVWGDEFWKD